MSSHTIKGELNVPQRKASVKELRKAHTRHLHNLDIKTDLRKTTKKFLASVTAKKTDEAKTNLNVLYKKLDKAAKRNIIQKNTASRRKSRFSRMILGL